MKNRKVNQLEYIAEQDTNRLFNIYNSLNRKLKSSKDENLLIIKQKIDFVLKTRFN